MSPPLTRRRQDSWSLFSQQVVIRRHRSCHVVDLYVLTIIKTYQTLSSCYTMTTTSHAWKYVLCFYWLEDLSLFSDIVFGTFVDWFTVKCQGFGNGDFLEWDRAHPLSSSTDQPPPVRSFWAEELNLLWPGKGIISLIHPGTKWVSLWFQSL